MKSSKVMRWLVHCAVTALCALCTLAHAQSTSDYPARPIRMIVPFPAGGGVGYEIFDKGDAFSSTSFVQNINHMRALEGELSRTIRSISRVQAARVHLVIPEKRLFERDREPPRASIALKLGGDLDAAQVRAIRHLVASAVNGMKP